MRRESLILARLDWTGLDFLVRVIRRPPRERILELRVVRSPQSVVTDWTEVTTRVCLGFFHLLQVIYHCLLMNTASQKAKRSRAGAAK